LLLRHLDRSKQITPDGGGGGSIKKSFSGNCKEKPAVTESATQSHILSFGVKVNNTLGQKYVMHVGRAGTRLRVHSLWVTPDYAEPNSWTYNIIEVSGHNLESSQV
jgi:hypothetical protein